MTDCTQTMNGENCFFNHEHPDDYCDSCYERNQEVKT